MMKLAPLFLLASVTVAYGSPAIVSWGLKNLGNTCYMNAQLECCYHIPKIREIILQSATTTSNPGIQALQSLFAEMESDTTAPIQLCRNLRINVLEQQDSQEFWKLLLPALNLPTLTDLYQGAYEDYIAAVDDGREKRREEPFLDLSIDVIPPSVLDSLKTMFGEPELLEGDNGWRPEKGAPKVNAHKGSLLRAQGLPSILQLHLKRFQYDWQMDRMSKLNTRLTFPEELNLESVCAGKVDELDAVCYHLQSVVVHVGEYGSGHYYSYVRPDVTNNAWYRFDDERVTKVSFKDVTRDAYGGTEQGAGLWQRIRGKSSGWGGPKSSAYMLQYVKRSEVEKLYSENA